jgi:TfoX/Sxy family transcriptional regulator of competence genes
VASDASYVEYCREQSGLGEALVARRMFGEYALYLEARMVALVCDNQLYVKPTEAGHALLKEVAMHPPYPQAKPWFRIDAELDDREALRRLLLATAAALPLPAPKPVKKTVPKKAAKKAK